MEVGGQSPRSRQQAQALLSGALSTAVKNKLILSNPAKEVSKITLNKKTITPLTGDEVKTLLHNSMGTFMCARLHIALLLGLRQGEALGLSIDDIDFESSTLSVYKQVEKINGAVVHRPLKTSTSMRSLVIPARSLDVLRDHLKIIENMKNTAGVAWKENGLFFPNGHGEPLNSKVDYNRWLKALKKAGIKRRSLHNARHTAGTLLYNSNIGIETIRRILGHSSVLMTSNTYVHNSEKPLRAAAREIDTFLDDADGVEE